MALPRISDYVARERDNIVNPVSRCYRQSRVFNQYTNEYIWVDCGHCESCLSRKANTLSMRVQNECKQHKWSFFFTLTYDNSHLPLLEYSFDDGFFITNRPISSSIHKNLTMSEVEVRKYLDIDSLDLYKLQPCRSDYNGIAVVNRFDVQCFLKRLRINLKRNLIFDKYVNNKPSFVKSDSLAGISDIQKSLRYFIASEYGPSTFRPHYHGIIWTDSDVVAEYLQRSIPACWSLCSPDRVDVQIVQSSAPQYVAGYVNSVINLPKILQTKFTRPFVLSSKNPIIGSCKTDYEKACDVIYNGTVEELVEKHDSEKSFYSYVPINRTFLNRFFATPKSYGFTPDYDYLSLFDKYENGRFQRKYKKVDGVTKLDSYASCPCDNLGMVYINSYAYCYQDYRFYRCMSFWTSQLHKFPLRDSSGRLTGEYVTKQLSTHEYLKLFDKLYSTYKLNILRKFYLSMEYAPEVLKPLYGYSRSLDMYYLHHYPEFVYSLPRELDFDWYRIFINTHKLPLMEQMSMNFGSVYKYRCVNGNIITTLRDDISICPLDSITRNYRARVHDTFLRSTLKKHYNEKFSNLHYNN